MEIPLNSRCAQEQGAEKTYRPQPPGGEMDKAVEFSNGFIGGTRQPELQYLISAGDRRVVVLAS